MLTAVSRSLPLPPGNSGLPALLDALRFLRDPYFLERRIEKYGPISRLQIPFQPMVFMGGPEAVKFVLSTGMHHFSWREGWPLTFRELLGDSLFVQDGAEHRQKRKLLVPAFHRQALENYLSAMDQIVQRYLVRWERLGRFAWYPEFKQLAFEIAAKLLLGDDPGPRVAGLSRAFNALTGGFFSLPLRWRVTAYGRAIRARDEILTHIEQAIARRQQEPAQDALGLLIQSRDEDGNALSAEELKAQALLLLFAGHETTASLLTALGMALALNPDVLARARAEQRQFGDAPLTMEQIRQMPYLDQVLKETERLYPSVPGGFRGVVEPFEFGGYRVPKGWLVFYSIRATHHAGAIYLEPERFDPERFAAEQAPFTLVGFGGGPRVCLGVAFAQLEMKVVCAHLLRRYAWELDPGQDLSLNIMPTWRPRAGLRVSFRRL
jgi:cytochrome P450